MSESVKYPFFIRLAAILLCLIGLFVILYFGQDIIFPILLSLLFAIILRPVVAFLIRRLRFPHFLAVIFAIVLFVLIFLGLFYFISMQVSDMADDWVKIKRNFYYHLEHFQQLIRDNFHVSKREQNEIIDNAAKNGLKSGNEIVGSTLNSFSDLLLDLTLIPIYTFLFLLYQNLFVTFLTKLYKQENHKKLREILVQIKIAVQSYVVGLLFEMVAVSILTTFGLYLIGVEYFILLGIITGILNLVPYIGILFAGALSIVVSLSGSTDLSIVFGVIVVNVIVQLIDNNILVPMFVNSKVQINAFVSIVGIIVGRSRGCWYRDASLEPHPCPHAMTSPFAPLKTPVMSTQILTGRSWPELPSLGATSRMTKCGSLCSSSASFSPSCSCSCRSASAVLCLIATA